MKFCQEVFDEVKKTAYSGEMIPKEFSDDICLSYKVNVIGHFSLAAKKGNQKKAALTKVSRAERD